MNRQPLSTLAIAAILFSLSGLAAAQDTDLSEENVAAILDLAARDLDWLSETETVRIDKETLSFMVRDPNGMMAVTVYGSDEAAQSAFSEGSGGVGTSHGAAARSDQGGHRHLG